MYWNEAMREGFALAATIAHDPAASHARRGLVVDALQPLEGTLRGLRNMKTSERRDRVAAIATRMAPSLAGNLQAPPRARALLASAAPKPVGTAWLRVTPPPRTGYVPPTGLIPALRRAASSRRKEQGWGGR